MNNARINWDGVSITLAPGQTLNHYQAEPTDEGYSYRAQTFTHHLDGTVTCSTASGGRDCDGRLDYYSDLVWDHGRWELESRSQRDEYAEAAGY